MCCPDGVETLYRTVFYDQTDSQIEGILIRESESREAGGCLSWPVDASTNANGVGGNRYRRDFGNAIKVMKNPMSSGTTKSNSHARK